MNWLLIVVLVLAGLYGFRQRIANFQNKNRRMRTPTTLPIFYRYEVNINIHGLEALHSFDTMKFQKVHDYLVERGVFAHEQFTEPRQATQEELALIHTREFLDNLNYSSTLAQICEFPPLGWIQNWILRWYILTPLLYHVGATIEAGEVALREGWAITLSGGMHHSSSKFAHGWCVYADISISIRNLILQSKIKKVMIIDLDVHQGDGHEKDKRDGVITKQNDIYIIDMYRHQMAEQEVSYMINGKQQMRGDVWDDLRYMESLLKLLDDGFTNFLPDIVYYNAGTDILAGDPLGGMNIGIKTVIERDELVFRECMRRNIPIVMVLSGGYAKDSPLAIGKSIENLANKFKLNKSDF